MTTHVRSRGVLSLSTLFIIIFPVAVFAASQGNEGIGHMTANAAGLSWQIGADNETVTLTITGPNDFTYTHDFASARSISLKMREIGTGLLDGSYTYELRAVPHISQGVRMQLAAARAKNDDAAIDRIKTEAGLGEPLVQSGAFAILNGSFVSSDTVEPGAPKVGASAAMSRGDTGAGGTVTSQVHNPPVRALDVVTADDAIIQGSLCVGLDCVNNESFGFDTVRLKENNTRIKFDDTSTSTGFPNNDWQLTANDSASGGANKFSIDDVTNSKTPFTVTGNSPTNSIFVASTGKVGFRTATPGLDLHISTGDTPAIRQEQTNASGFTAQTWDIGANEANWFVRDVTGGSRLPLRIRPGAPTSSVDISASGNVGIGTASPGAKLDVGTGATARGGFTKFLIGNGGDTAQLEFYGASKSSAISYNGTILSFFTNGTPFVQALNIDNAGNVGIGTAAPGSQLVIANGATTSSINAGSAQFTVSSSRTFKRNIEAVDVPDILRKIEAVPVVTYDFRNNGPKNRLGLIAEDFHQVLGRGDDKHIDGQDVQMALWMAVQKLSAENKALTDRLAKLEASIAPKP